MHLILVVKNSKYKFNEADNVKYVKKKVEENILCLKKTQSLLPTSDSIINLQKLKCLLSLATGAVSSTQIHVTYHKLQITYWSLIKIEHQLVSNG